MRQVIANVTTVFIGSRGPVSIVPDQVVDLDQVVGDHDGRPLTLADAFGEKVTATWKPVETEQKTETAAARRPRTERSDRSAAGE